MGKDRETERLATRLTTLGRDPARHDGTVNPPAVRASTILFDRLDAYEDRKDHHTGGGLRYGRAGTPPSIHLEQAVAALEGAADAFLFPSGQAAIACALLSLVKAGDELLVADSVYGPNRMVCEKLLPDMGVSVTFVPPNVGADVAEWFTEKTKAVVLESPGSQTFEMQDLPAIAAACRARGILTMTDNTWASPLGCQPVKHGIDMIVHAGTKHLGGHSDIMLGLIVTNETTKPLIHRMARAMGQCAGSEEIYLALRGLRTLKLRLERATATALVVTRWLQARPEVERVLFPPLESDPGHALWKRDYSGACGLFGVVLKPGPSEAQLQAMIDGYRLFGIGASWGGYESLCIRNAPKRNHPAFLPDGHLLRYHVGLEDPEDLIADLAEGFGRLAR